MVTRCPGCAKEIDEKDENCPFCNWDFKASGGINPLFKPAKAKGKPPKILPREPYRPLRGLEPPEPLGGSPVQRDYLSLFLLAILVVAAIVWRPRSHHPPFGNRAGSDSSSESIIVVEPVMKAAAPHKPLARAHASAAIPNRRNRVNPMDEPIIIASAEEAEDGEEAPPSKDPEWRLGGIVFDLLTLKPVTDAELVFTARDTNRRFPTATDSSGHYRIHLPPDEEGYSLRIKHSSYEAQYAQDEDGALKRLGKAERSAFATQVSHTLIQYETIRGSVGERTRRDFALVPQER